MLRNAFRRLTSIYRERLSFLAALDPVNARAFLITISAFKDGGVEFMFLFANAAGLSLLQGIADRGPLDRLDWTLAWMLRAAGALEAAAPSFTVSIREDAGNVARFKNAWAGLDFSGSPPTVPATLAWTFILDASYKGVLIEILWDKREHLADIEGYPLHRAPDMMGFSRS